LILSEEKYGERLDQAIFPGILGGPLMHLIAAKAVAFEEALRPEFVDYQRQVIINAKVLAEELMNFGFDLVSGGTDNHLILIDLNKKGITGRDAEEVMGKVGISMNKNTIPFDKRGPKVASGLRLGTPALTTRGMREAEMKIIAGLISKVLENPDDEKTISEARNVASDLCHSFPILQYLDEEV